MKYSKENIGSYLYSRLPQYHRILDEQNNLLLKRFMEVIDEGFKESATAIDRALAKVQASKCPEEELHVIAKSMGADWIDTIHPKYQRTIVSMLTKLYKQKGTLDTIRFIASELSGFEAKIIEGEIPKEYFHEGDEKKRLFTVKLQAPELDDPVQAQQHETTISEVIDKFIPVHTKYVLVITYFYDEPYYKRIKEQDKTFLKEDRGMLSKTFKGTQPVFDIIKFRYDQETNFHMIGNPDILGLTVNPEYKLVTNFKTTKTRNDILHHSLVKISTSYTKRFDGDEKKKDILAQDFGNYLKEVSTQTEQHGFQQKLKTLNVSVFSLPQVNKEDYEIIHTLKVNGGLDTSKNTHTESKEVQKIQNDYSQDVKLMTNFNKSEKVMVKCILEDKPTNDLGINKYVLCTGKPNCILSTKEARLSIPSYIDKVTQNGQLNYIYE